MIAMLLPAIVGIFLIAESGKRVAETALIKRIIPKVFCLMILPGCGRIKKNYTGTQTIVISWYLPRGCFRRCRNPFWEKRIAG
jgi:hypothetical protein